jgi:hypothetical protein
LIPIAVIQLTIHSNLHAISRGWITSFLRCAEPAPSRRRNHLTATPTGLSETELHGEVTPLALITKSKASNTSLLASIEAKNTFQGSDHPCGAISLCSWLLTRFPRVFAKF